MSLIEKFGEVSKEYDKQRRQLIPCYNDFYGVPMDILDHPKENINVLDIGAGTGLFSSFLLKKYPKAKITLIDLSSEMIDVAKKRFKNYSNFKYICDDYLTHEFSEKFDVVISALSIHHLNQNNKKKIYKKVYSLLNNKGRFFNADQVLSPSKIIEKRYMEISTSFIKNSGLSSDEIKKANERMSYDDPSKLEEQIQWLLDCGFKDVDCVYKYYYFFVLYGIK
jgi:tRNA (cmo5U34)-methyltransferase